MTALRGHRKLWDIVVGFKKKGNQNPFQEAQELRPAVIFFALVTVQAGVFFTTRESIFLGC